MSLLSPGVRLAPTEREYDKHSPLNAAQIVQEHPELLRPRTLVKRLLQEVNHLAIYCDEAACKELIGITANLKQCNKTASECKSKQRSIDLERQETIDQLETFVSKLKERDQRHTGRARQQLLVAKELQKEKGSIGLITTVGPVPKTRARVHLEAAELLRAQLKRQKL